jgi:hypothetical protein
VAVIHKEEWRIKPKKINATTVLTLDILCKPLGVFRTNITIPPP